MKRLSLILALVPSCAQEVSTSVQGAPVNVDEPSREAEPVEVPPEQQPVLAEDPAPPPAPPPMGLAEPPTLKMSVFGECKYPGIDFVSDEVFVHHREYVHRMGPDGTPAQTLRFGLRFPESEGFEPMTTSFRGVGGRWPDQFYAVADYGYREYDGVKLARWQDGTWKFANVLGRKWNYASVWAWQDNTILTLASSWREAGNTGPRFGIVQGAGKGPSTRDVMRQAGCNADSRDDALKGVHVSPTGPVTAIITCRSTWLARWTPGDREGTSVRLGDAPRRSTSMALDERGDGYILLDSKDDTLLRWKNGDLTEQPLPEFKDVSSITASPDGQPWILADGVVHRRDGESWQRETFPGEANVSALSGVSVSAPWAIRSDKSVWARLADGTWTSVDVPLVGPDRTDPVPVRIAVRKPGDAWLIAKYRKLVRGRKAMRQVRAIYTERPVDTAYECGPINWD